jgi:hypothetical protein
VRLKTVCPYRPAYWTRAVTGAVQRTATLASGWVKPVHQWGDVKAGVADAWQRGRFAGGHYMVLTAVDCQIDATSTAPFVCPPVYVSELNLGHPGFPQTTVTHQLEAMLEAELPPPVQPLHVV